MTTVALDGGFSNRSRFAAEHWRRYSAPAVMALAELHGIEMPIASNVFRVVTGQQSAKYAFRGLLKSVAGAESEPG